LPPIRGVTIGEGSSRSRSARSAAPHEKTFQPCGYALLIEDTEDARACAQKLAALKAATYERVAQKLRSNLVAVKNAWAAKLAVCVGRSPARSSTARAHGRAGGDRGGARGHG
jgi:hypothetical protein